MSPRGITNDELAVLPIVRYGGPLWAVPEVLFEEKHLIPALQELLQFKVVLFGVEAESDKTLDRYTIVYTIL
jgi:hypothetical protein